MNYGQIFGDTFRVMWREKKLWVFGLIGLALSSLLGMVAGVAGLSLQRNMLGALNREMSRGGPEDPARILSAVFGNLAAFGVLFGLVMLGSLVAYVINLAMRPATIREAGRAWRGEAVSVRRGSREGVSAMLGFFGVDLLWAIVPVLFAGAGYAVMFGTIFGVTVLSSGGGNGDAAGVGILAVVLLVFCCFAIFALLFAAFYAVLAPMMYQSLAQGRRSFGDALAEAWALAKVNWGPLIIFALMVWGVGLLLGILVQAITTPFSMAFMGDWMTSLMGSMEGPSPTMPMPNYAIMIPGMMLLTAVSYLVSSFLQSFRLTLYTKVYGVLTAPETPESAEIVEVAE